MKEHIDIFLPCTDERQAEQLKTELLTSTLVQDVWFVDGMRSSESLSEIASQSASPYVALVVKDASLQLGQGALERMVQMASDSGAMMVYADHYEKKEVDGEWKTEKHPAIDYQLGSVRDDSDFSGNG